MAFAPSSLSTPCAPPSLSSYTHAEPEKKMYRKWSSEIAKWARVTNNWKSWPSDLKQKIKTFVTPQLAAINIEKSTYSYNAGMYVIPAIEELSTHLKEANCKWQFSVKKVQQALAKTLPPPSTRPPKHKINPPPHLMATLAPLENHRRGSYRSSSPRDGGTGSAPMSLGGTPTAVTPTTGSPNTGSSGGSSPSAGSPTTGGANPVEPVFRMGSSDNSPVFGGISATGLPPSMALPPSDGTNPMVKESRSMTVTAAIDFSKIGSECQAALNETGGLGKFEYLIRKKGWPQHQSLDKVYADYIVRCFNESLANSPTRLTYIKTSISKIIDETKRKSLSSKFEELKIKIDGITAFSEASIKMSLDPLHQPTNAAETLIQQIVSKAFENIAVMALSSSDREEAIKHLALALMSVGKNAELMSATLNQLHERFKVQG